MALTVYAYKLLVEQKYRQIEYSRKQALKNKKSKHSNPFLSNIKLKTQRV